MCFLFSILDIFFKLTLWNSVVRPAQQMQHKTKMSDTTLCASHSFFFTQSAQNFTAIESCEQYILYEEQPTLLHFYWTHKWENTVSDTTARYYLGGERSYFPPMQRRPRFYSIIMQFFWEEEILHLHCHLRNTSAFCIVRATLTTRKA